MFLTCYKSMPWILHSASCSRLWEPPGNGALSLAVAVLGGIQSLSAPQEPLKVLLPPPCPTSGPTFSLLCTFTHPWTGLFWIFLRVFPRGRLKFFTLVQYMFIYSVTSSGATDRKKAALSRVNLSQTCYLKTANDFSHQAGPLVQKSRCHHTWAGLFFWDFREMTVNSR